jgi:hypothetical protein
MQLYMCQSIYGQLLMQKSLYLLYARETMPTSSHEVNNDIGMCYI